MVFFGVLFSNFPFSHTQNIEFFNSFLGAIFVSIGNTSETLIGAFLINKYIGIINIQKNASNIIKFIFIVVFVAPVFCSLEGSAVLYFYQNNKEIPFNLLFSSWWISDSISMLIFTPLILSFYNKSIYNKILNIKRRSVIIFMLLYFLLFAIVFYVIGNSVSLFNLPTNRLEFIVIPIIILFAYKYPYVGINISIITVALISVYFTSKGQGNFISENSKDSFMLMQFFVFGVSITGLIFSSSINEKNVSLKSLEESEKQFKLLFEHSGTANAFFDNNFNLIYINSISQDNLGKRASEIIGKNVNEVFHPKYAVEIEEKMQLVLLSKKPVQYDSKYKIKGQIRYFKVKFVPVFDSFNKIKGIQFIAGDITDQKNIEEELVKAKIKAEESNKLKSAFLSNVSHEIRNPIHSITGFSSLIAKENVTYEKRLYYSDIINKSATGLLDLVNDVLDISKIESGQMPVNITFFNIKELITEVINLYQEQANKKGIDLIFDSENEAVGINSDRAKVYQIISNLVSNAIKFTLEGYVKVDFEFRRNFLKIFVIDTGIGIDKENHEKIFERFIQATNDTSKKNGGTGLGLAICKGNTELLGGKIFVESNSKNGSRFTLSLPV